ncbi:metallophosphoesterase [Candidatus Woesearchaeota archaeon]|nr:metallophosphoesterase [Candidatus Woesearchaeota archaeon]
MGLVDVLPGIAIADLALYLKKENILIIGDVHLGYEEAMAKHGVFIPRFQFKDTIERIARIFSLLQHNSAMQNVQSAAADLQQRKSGSGGKETKFEAIVVNGDLKHDFASISDQEWRDILKLLDFLLQHSGQVILVKGNHDVKLSPIARKRNIVVVENIAINDKFICHGHVVPTGSEFKKSKIIIVGNEHPAVSLRDGARTELYKCFVLGRWKGSGKEKKMIVMPSFNQVTIGTDILKERFISPFMQQNLGSFDIFVAGDETYHFGKVRDIA